MKIEKVDAAAFDAEPDRFTLVDGNRHDAPTCPFGNHFTLVGFDKKHKQYVRYTKSVYKRIKERLETQYLLYLKIKPLAQPTIDVLNQSYL